MQISIPLIIYLLFYIIKKQKTFVMKQNMGIIDRIGRVTLAIAFASIWFLHFVTGIAGIVLLTLACVFLITSVVGVCPLYNILGINTCSHKKTA